MTAIALPSTTNLRAVVSRHSARLKEALRRARSLAARRQESEYARNVAKAVLSSEKSKAVEQVVTLVVDIAQRGTLEDAEAIGRALVAIARVEWAGAHPGVTGTQMSRAEAHLLEQEAQGKRETAEARMSEFPGLGNFLAFLAADAEYERAARLLRQAVQAEVATT